MIKRLLSIILAVSLFPVVYVTAETNEYDASVFGNNAEYLLEEHFAETTSTGIGGENERIVSGWDIDYRGGDVRMCAGALRLNDTSLDEKVSMKRKHLSVKDGSVVFETGVTVENAVKTRFDLILGNENQNLLHLIFADGIISLKNSDGDYTDLIDFTYNTKIQIKADISFDNRLVSLLINNTDVFSVSVPEDFNGTDSVYFSTGSSEICSVMIHYVNVYRNYIVNEKFINAPEGSVPNGFVLSEAGSGSGIAYAPGSPYVDDRNGFFLINSSSYPANSLETTFDNNNSKTYVSWKMLIPSRHSGVKVKVYSGSSELLDVSITENDIYCGNSLLRADYTENLWYTFELEFNDENDTLNSRLNYKSVLTDVGYCGGIPDKLVFEKTSEGIGEIIIDDIEVTPVFEMYADYPSEPEPSSSDEANTGMIMYSMWREGMHFGWDTVSPYADERKPLLGYYTEGQREVADWQSKWMSEHGIDYAIYSFVRPNSVSGEPIKQPSRGEDLFGGYMRSFYKPYMKFAILFSAFGINSSSSSADEQKYHGADEFIENVIPYISEYYFQDPQYMKINNKLPVYAYAIGSMVSLFGSEQEAGRVIAALDAEAVRLGYDGIIFCADAASTKAHANVEAIDMDCVTIWSYGSQSGNVDGLKAKINSEYLYEPDAIASVPMGYNDTPWRDSESSMMTPDEVSSICEYVASHSSYEASEHKMVTFTCWNEYGEGHFYCPSTIGGFGYLNAIRSAFTSDGEKSNQEIPSEQSIARMEAFYTGGRGMLKRRPDQKYTEADVQNRELLYRMDFNSSEESGWTYNGNCSASFVDGSIEATATGKIPGLRFGIENGPDIADVKAIRLRAHSEGEKFFRVYYRTEDNTDEGQGKYFDSTAITRPDGYTDYILYPNVITEDSGNPVPTGRITSIRISPEDNLYLYGQTFGLDYIEMLGDYTDYEILYRFEPDDQNIKKMNFSSCTAAFTGGSLECTAKANDPQIYIKIPTGVDIADVTHARIKGYTTGCNEFRLFYITENNTAYGGGKVFRSSNISGSSEYEEYILNHDSISSMPTGKITALRLDPADDIYLQGATFGIDRIELCGKKTNYKLIVDDINANLTSSGKTINDTAFVPVYSVLLNEAGAFPVWDEKNKTLTAEKNGNILTVTADSATARLNGSNISFSCAPYFESGNLYVPCEEYFDALGYDVSYFDSINTFVCEPKVGFDFSVKGYDYGENILINYANSTSADYTLSNMTLSLDVESVGETEGYKLIPATSGTDGLFTTRFVNYNGVRTKLDDIIKLGGKMKVSFSYLGSCSQISIENRSGNSIDQSAKKTAISPDDWTEFSYVFDNSAITLTGDARWLTMRIKSTSNQSPYVYIKDFKVQCYEETDLTTYESDVNIILTTPKSQSVPVSYELFAAGYDSNDNLVSLNPVLSGSTADSGDITTETTYIPDGSYKIKLFLWSDFKPLCKIKELHKR